MQNTKYTYFYFPLIGSDDDFHFFLLTVSLLVAVQSAQATTGFIAGEVCHSSVTLVVVADMFPLCAFPSWPSSLLMAITVCLLQAPLLLNTTVSRTFLKVLWSDYTHP